MNDDEQKSPGRRASNDADAQDTFLNIDGGVYLGFRQ